MTSPRPKGLRWWPWILTVVVAALALGVGISTSKWSDAANIGNYVAGFASALAFIWLIAGYVQQGDELALQREELRAQRESLDLQKAELHRMAIHAALGQIATMLADFRIRLPQHGIPGLNSYEDITHVLMRHLEHLGRASRSTVNDEIINAYVAWRAAEGIALRFLQAIRMAAEVYAHAGEDVALRFEEDTVEFVLSNDTVLRSIPHISDCMHSGHVMAVILRRLGPWRARTLKRYQLALSALFPGSTPDAELESVLDSQVRWFEKENPL